jgi:hypothetical protein
MMCNNRTGISKGKVAMKKRRDPPNRESHRSHRLAVLSKVGKNIEQKRVKEMHGTEIRRSKIEVEKEPPRREIYSSMIMES